MSQYVQSCHLRAVASIQELRSTGKEPNAIEISQDVLGAIQLGGINLLGEHIFAGLPVVERPDATDHIQAVIRG